MKSRRKKSKPTNSSQIQVQDQQRLWVLFDPQTKQFAGARWREGKHALMYSLGSFDTGYKCTSRLEAKQTLNVVRNFKQYSALTAEEAKRIKVRRIRSRILILDGDSHG